MSSAAAKPKTKYVYTPPERRINGALESRKIPSLLTHFCPIPTTTTCPQCVYPSPPTRAVAVSIAISLLTSPHFFSTASPQITQNPVNQANCGSSTCNCGDRWVYASDMLKTRVLTSLQLPVQSWGMQVLNGHSYASHLCVCNLDGKSVGLLLSEWEREYVYI